jgi:hypothetical protein
LLALRPRLLVFSSCAVVQIGICSVKNDFIYYRLG